jgi:mannosyl-oligosaccharide alpha-1,2-mannosidase
MLSPFARRWVFLCILVFTSLSLYLKFSSTPESDIERLTRPHFFKPAFSWKDVPIQHPVTNLTPLPSGPLVDIPRVQHAFELEQESEDDMVERQRRLAAVKKAFIHSWEGYKENAWMQDEVAPLSGEHKNGFGGWGATLVDSLDTLWIMGLEKEFELAIDHHHVTAKGQCLRDNDPIFGWTDECIRPLWSEV